MYAIIRSGGKQYKVKAGDTLRVEKLTADLGSEFQLNEILVVGGDKTFIGEPLLKDASVTAIVTRQQKGPKVIVFKKKRRQGYRRMRGHRQFFTELFIKSITSPEGETKTAESDAQVVDPAKKAAKLARMQEIRESRRLSRSEDRRRAKEEGSETKKPKAEVKPSGLKKKSAKKVGQKKLSKKKTVAKKKVAKKTSVNKKKTTKKKV